METNKEKYRKLCMEKPILLFMQAWWFDAVCLPNGKHWDVLLYEENGKIVGAMPYHITKKNGFKIVEQPQCTQYNGIWIDYPQNQKLHKRYSFEKKVIDDLIAQLESLKVDFYSQNFHHSVTNWQPFYWKNFKQTTKYTYILKNITEQKKLFENIHPRYRQRIRKCETEFIVDYNLLPEQFYEFHKKSLKESGQKIDYSNSIFSSIYSAAIKRNQGKIISIKNKNNELLSALFFVWDTNNGYNLITARKIIDGSNDTSIFMIWKAIEFLKDKTQNYDFEGSMIEGVAYVNQQFGAEQTPYFRIEKSYSKLFSALKFLKNGID
jgi:hypothetical protein